jgi:ABC-type sugar transport system permease subunit
MSDLRTDTARWHRHETRLAWLLVLPAFATIGLVVLFPILWTVSESLHLHDLRMPWLGRPFIGGANYVEALADARFWSALGHTGAFVALTVSAEMTAGLGLALLMDHGSRARGLVRTAVLLPWAIPTVVAALVWRFIFESPGGLASVVLEGITGTSPTWFADAVAAWVPLVLGDVWKTTPFVALLLLAALQRVDRSLYEAAAVDGAGGWRQFLSITVPLVRPTLIFVVIVSTIGGIQLFTEPLLFNAGAGALAGGTQRQFQTVAMYLVEEAFPGQDFGYAAAIAGVLFLLIAVISAVNVWLISRIRSAE